ncbi:MAG: hypothetical protein AB8E82_03270 [Aureispira sp.]
MSSPIQKKDFLYYNFLENTRIYKQNKAYWARFVQQTLASYDIHPKPWLNQHYADGRPMQDGNPIYDALLGNGKAVRIIQIQPDNEEVLISAWIKQTESEEGTELEELVIHLQLTQKTRVAALTLLEKWVTTTNNTIMENFIQKVLDQV